MNPKSLWLFCSWRCSRSSPPAWPMAAQIIVLGAVYVLSCAVAYSGVSVGAQTVVSTPARPRPRRVPLLRHGDGRQGATLLINQFAG